MRLAIIIALTLDRRTVGRVLSPLLSATEAMAQLKAAVTSGHCPDARFPIVQAVALDSVIKEHRFRPTSGDIAQAIDAANQAAAADDSDLKAQLLDLSEKLEEADKISADEKQVYLSRFGNVVPIKDLLPKNQPLTLKERLAAKWAYITAPKNKQHPREQLAGLLRSKKTTTA